jgi:hypothetical protein
VKALTDWHICRGEDQLWRKYQSRRPESRDSDGCIKTVTATDAFLPIHGGRPRSYKGKCSRFNWSRY